jgi:hypothetical protein
MRNNDNMLFSKAVENDEIFDFLIGSKGYEVRISYVYMPTNTEICSYEIKKYIDFNPDFDTNKIVNAFMKISNNPEWAWIIIYYVSSFIENGLTFLPYDILYKNIEKNRDLLMKNNGWICFNFTPKYDNLWDIIKYENDRLLKKGYLLPFLN